MQIDFQGFLCLLFLGNEHLTSLYFSTLIFALFCTAIFLYYALTSFPSPGDSPAAADAGPEHTESTAEADDNSPTMGRANNC